MFEMILKAIRLNSSLRKLYFTMLRVFGTIPNHTREGKKAVEHISTGLRCGKYNMTQR